MGHHLAWEDLLRVRLSPVVSAPEGMRGIRVPSGTANEATSLEPTQSSPSQRTSSCGELTLLVGFQLIPLMASEVVRSPGG